MTMTAEEINYVLKGRNPDDFNPLLFYNNLSKIERASLQPEELELRTKLKNRASRYRYAQKNPEKKKESLEKLKEMNAIKKAAKQAEKEANKPVVTSEPVKPHLATDLIRKVKKVPSNQAPPVQLRSAPAPLIIQQQLKKLKK